MYRDNRFGERNFENTAPVKVGERYRVKIEGMGSGGDGIARIKGFVIFVPDTKVGDEVDIVINSVKKRFAFAEKI
ncbi:TRAM domain-containing protein [Palaeococcus ferrophilus]|uniref:TRAM domain-containing protein n=1 Tax=Palaeococcus ferrophilus TaxID=83868 RepID=UPI00064F0CAC|nr:TRAM domain-containing protein [Palaeococcus ferrophilus]